MPGVNREIKRLRATNVPEGANPEKWANMTNKERKSKLKELKKHAKEEAISNAQTNAKVSTVDNVEKPAVEGAQALENGVEPTGKTTSWIKREDVPDEHLQVYDEFIDSVDDGHVAFKEKVDAGITKDGWHYNMNKTTPSEVDEIKNLTGIDTTDFKHTIFASELKHIEKRHGKFGHANQTMANINDVGRIKYVLNNPDSITRTVDEFETLYLREGLLMIKGKKHH